MTGRYSLRIRLGHTITHDSITFRLSDDLPPATGPALAQFELECARIAAEDAIPLRNEIARLRGLRVAAEMAGREAAATSPPGRIMSGPESGPLLWDDINAIPKRKTRMAVYTLGCRCQELETLLRRAIERIERLENAGPSPTEAPDA